MGKNERLLGQLLKDPELRSKVFICTKFGVDFNGQGMTISGKPEYVRECCEESLKNLQVDCIDLYYQHRVRVLCSPFPRLTNAQVDRTIPIEDTWQELKRLQEEGKVKHLGISEATADEIRRAHAVAPISACQIEVRTVVQNVGRSLNASRAVFSVDAGHQNQRDLGYLPRARNRNRRV